MNFSDRLVELRKEKGLTQEGLSALLQKGRSTISGYENEGKEPDFDKLCFLAEYFGVTTDYLLGRDDERTPAASLFHNDSVSLQKHYDALPPELKAVVAEIFDDFYVLINRDMRRGNEEALLLYRDLMRKLRSARHDIRRQAAGPRADKDDFAQLLSMENALKNDLAVILDELLEVDLRR